MVKIFIPRDSAAKALGADAVAAAFAGLEGVTVTRNSSPI